MMEKEKSTNTVFEGNFTTRAVKNNVEPSDFEHAMDTAGFGTFNILLLLVGLMSAMAGVFETSNVSYILPSAECDLKLTLLDKGILNGITYAGMITSAIFWGYLADIKGRKKILVGGYLGNSICVFGAAMSQNVLQLMIFKYLGGLVMSGPFAVLMTYITEMHGRKYRARVMMMIGMMFTMSTLTLPLLALAILPNKTDLYLFNLTFHSWQTFLAVTAVPCLIGGFCLIFFPESPRFLMSQGRNAEALKTFQKIYALNKRLPRDSFPIKELINEVPTKQNISDASSDATTDIATIEGMKTDKSIGESNLKKRPKVGLRQGLQQLRPLFSKPFLGLSLRVYLMNFLLLFGQNTVRLWLPQLFASIAEYEKISDGSVSSMCTILEFNVNRTSVIENAETMDSCEVVITIDAYTNNIIVALAGFVGYVIAAIVVNRVGSKIILCLCLLTAAVCGYSLYWSVSSLTTLIISSIFVTVGSISATSVIGASVNLFPTSLRTMVLSVTMMFGRSGSILGNILFPMFMSLGCIPPFVMVGSVMLFASLLSAFLPIKTRSALS